MERQGKLITQLQINQPIPYYGKRFAALIDVLNERSGDLNNSELEISTCAELEVIISGIMYYYTVIMSEGDFDHAKKKRLCAKLVESTNKAIYALLDELDNGYKDIVRKYMMAYREYLQNIENIFREEQIEKGISAPRLIFTFSLELLNSRVCLNNLFTTIYESEIASPEVQLCSVFAPSDVDIKNVFRYLPMLTHEVSHNFKYSNTKDRNEFIVDYMLKCISDIIIRRLLIHVSSSPCTLFIGKAQKTLVDALAATLRQILLELEPNYINEGHLDYLPSLIYSVIYATYSKETSVNVFFNDKNIYDVLCDSFVFLAKSSTLEWYIADKENIDKKTDEEKIASLLLDVFTEKNQEQVIKWYKEISFQTDENYQLVNRFLSNYIQNNLIIDTRLIDIAIDEIILSIMEKIKLDFLDMDKKVFSDQGLLDEIILSLIENNNFFEKKLEEIIPFVPSEYSQTLYDFFDRCLSVRSCIDNIFLISRVNDVDIAKKKKSNQIIKKIYKSLYNSIETAMNNENLKPYFVTRNMNLLLIRLGLFEKETSDVFSKHYLSMLNEWGENNIYNTIEDYLNVYREVFADLSMCAAFQFNQLGYLRYMSEQFKSVREMGDSITNNMALERIHIVLRILEEQYGKQWLIEKYNSGIDLGISWTNEWNSIVALYLNGNREDEYDERYKSVYNNKILPSKWISFLQQDKVVHVVGEFYNENNISELKKKEICNLFVQSYTELFEEKIKIGTNFKDDPIKIILGENKNDKS